jgi:hypothetical protein
LKDSKIDPYECQMLFYRHDLIPMGLFNICLLYLLEKNSNVQAMSSN